MSFETNYKQKLAIKVSDKIILKFEFVILFSISWVWLHRQMSQSRKLKPNDINDRVWILNLKLTST